MSRLKQAQERARHLTQTDGEGHRCHSSGQREDSERAVACANQRAKFVEGKRAVSEQRRSQPKSRSPARHDPHCEDTASSHKAADQAAPE